MRLNLLCDPKKADFDHNDAHDFEFVDTDAECMTTVSLKSYHACYRFSLGALWRYIESNSVLFGLILIGVGLFVGFFGKKLLKPTIFLVGAIAIILVLSVLLFTVFLDANSSSTTEWVVFGVSCAIGIVGGLLLAYLARFGVALLSAWGGVCLGLMLYSSFVYKIDNSTQWAFWVFVILMGLAGAALGYFLFNHALILSTSVIGSYFVIRGISFFAGGFPNEQLII